MATIDAVMSDKRAADIVEKYRQRIDGWRTSPESPEDEAEYRAHTTELQADIANAINAAITEVVGREPTPAEKTVKAKADADAAERVVARNATHMPGSQGKRG